MKVHFKKPIKEKLDEAIIEAKAQGKKIDWIELSGEEWQELETWLNHVRTVFLTDPTIESPAHYDGVEIRKKVEPEVEDEVVLHFPYLGSLQFIHNDSFFTSSITQTAEFSGRDGNIELKLYDAPWVRPGDELEVRVKRRSK